MTHSTTITNAKFVKCLKINDSSKNVATTETQFTQEQLGTFLQSLPQLKRVDVSLAEVQGLRYLGFSENILKSNSSGNEVLARLEGILATIGRKEGMARYFKVCYALRDRIKRLVVHYMMEKNQSG